MKTSIFYLSIVLSLLFVSCGGNKHENTDSDITPPTITATFPLSNATEIELTSTVSVTFDELMMSSSINSSTFYLTDSLANPVSGTISFSNTRYTFTPDSLLEYATNYTATITNDVADDSGNKINNSYSWSFTTLHQPGSTSPLTLGYTGLTSSEVTLKAAFTNPLNHTTTVWFEYGLSTSYGSETAHSVYAAVADIQYEADIVGLTDRTTYHYRVVTQNQSGIFYGEDRTFRTYILPDVIASGLNAPSSLHLYNNELYWVEVYSDAVRKVSTAGGSVTTEASTSLGGNSASLDLVDGILYWGDYINIWSKPAGSGVATSVVSGLTFNVYTIKAYGSDLYADSFGSMTKIALSDGSTSTIISDAYFSSYELDSEAIYWSEKTAGKISKAAHDGTSVITLGVNLSSPGSILLDSGLIYWQESNAIKSMSTAGGAISTIASNVSPSHMIKDATHIYISDNDALKKVDISSGEVTTLAVAQDIRSMAQDGNYVYWLTSGNSHYPPLAELKKCLKSY
ncbi:MAG: Ig-like domain-containing protein [Gammaproteobacteria bacterium]|nr:Ig-like domain-containing protein [Gammaproteobacteria bacterium]